MKQEINQKQWRGLTEKQKLKFANTVWIKNGKKTHKLHPPNIGQMIEFLAQGRCSLYLPGCSLGESEIDPETWCDTLWEAVKEELTKKD